MPLAKSTASAVALIAITLALSGCGGSTDSDTASPDPTESAASSSPSESPSTSASSSSQREPSGVSTPTKASLPPFTMPTKGDVLHRTMPPQQVDTGKSAIEFAIYHQTITTEGFDPQAVRLLAAAAAPGCRTCRIQLEYFRKVNARNQVVKTPGDFTYTGLLDAFKDGRTYHVAIEVSTPGGGLYAASGKLVRKYPPVPYQQRIVALEFVEGRWQVTDARSDNMTRTQVG